MAKTVSGIAIFVACCIFLVSLVVAFDSQEEKDAVDMASAAASQASGHLDRDDIVRDIRRDREEQQLCWSESAKDVATSLAKNCDDNG